jgi:Fe-S cluster biogenesis protein NfuA
VLTASERPQRIDSLEAAVDALLDAEVRPALHADGGDLELLGIEDGIVKVHLVGACRSCPASALTMKGGVERALLAAFPDEVLGVEAV